ncbi:homeobox protein knotted-1-like 6 [Canna indica]|uniref:Homeobox protein knotted-1-like 6 n=1 Tax=Canna indica TaxID=4628 RepID=A0AAQ3Q8G6_9LILI|nr:homeobox protein knotted-1-like 6 [Canna indica]
MEEFSQLGGNLWAAAGFMYNASSSSSSTAAKQNFTATETNVAMVGTTPSSAAPVILDRRYCSPFLLPTNFHHQNPISPPVLQPAPQSKPELGASTSENNIPPAAHHVDAIKAKIVSHPQYSNLVSAYIECQKAGTFFISLINSLHASLIN